MVQFCVATLYFVTCLWTNPAYGCYMKQNHLHNFSLLIVSTHCLAWLCMKWFVEQLPSLQVVLCNVCAVTVWISPNLFHKSFLFSECACMFVELLAQTFTYFHANWECFLLYWHVITTVYLMLLVGQQEEHPACKNFCPNNPKVLLWETQPDVEGLWKSGSVKQPETVVMLECFLSPVT